MPAFPKVTETERRFALGFTRLLCDRDLDARRGTVRRIRDLARALSNEACPGGDPSIAQRLIIQRASIISSICSHLETSMLLGQGEFSISDYIALTATLRRLLGALSDPRMRRQLKDITPNL